MWKRATHNEHGVQYVFPISKRAAPSAGGGGGGGGGLHPPSVHAAHTLVPAAGAADAGVFSTANPLRARPGGDAALDV